MQEDTFVPNFMHIGPIIAEIWWREKKKEKKDKSAEKYNLTEILKNCIFRKNGNIKN